MTEDKKLINYGNVEIDDDISDIKIYDMVYEQLEEILENNPLVTNIPIEEMYIGRSKTAMRLGKLHGYLLSLAYRKNGLQGDYINNMTVKKHITGKGNCSKKEMGMAIQERYPELKEDLPFATSTAVTKDRYKSDDIYDAIGVALTFIEKYMEE